MIKIKRAYDPVEENDDPRFLVDRMWPRGLKKERLKMEAWLKAVAPSDQLRRWFNHEPAKWNEFHRRYSAELDAKPETWLPLLQTAQTGDVTLLFGARDKEHNNAVVLRAYLIKRAKTKVLARHPKIVTA